VGLTDRDLHVFGLLWQQFAQWHIRCCCLHVLTGFHLDRAARVRKSPSDLPNYLLDLDLGGLLIPYRKDPWNMSRSCPRDNFSYRTDNKVTDIDTQCHTSRD